MINLHERMLPTSAGVEPATSWSPVGLCIQLSHRGRPPYIIKLSQIVWELWPAQDFCFRGDNYIAKKVKVVSFACAMPTGPPLHPYQMLSNLKQYWSYAQYFGFRGDNYIIKSCPVCTQHPFWSSSILSNIVKLCQRVSKLWSGQG